MKLIIKNKKTEKSTLKAKRKRKKVKYINKLHAVRNINKNPSEKSHSVWR